jgi:hypothetical protein
MKRFYFDLWDGVETYPDTEGSELDGLDAAKTEAVYGLMEIGKGRTTRWSDKVLVMLIRDESGPTLARLTLTLSLDEGSSGGFVPDYPTAH